MDATRALRIGLVGYGEVGKILGSALVERGVAWVGAWDILMPDAAQGPAMRTHARDAKVEAVASLAALLARADVVLSAVTASQAVAVAREAVPAIRRGTWFVDLNSGSPGAKREMSALIDGAGGRFVESAVMTSVPPYGIKVPMLIGGRGAAELCGLLAPLGFVDQIVERLHTERVDLISLSSASLPLRYRVVRDGRLLVCRDEAARVRFEADTVQRYLDFKPLRDRALERVRRRDSRGRLMVADLEIVHLWGGTAGNWGQRPLDLDEMEIMVVARRTGEPVDMERNWQ